MRRLRKSTENRLLCGVCGGIAEYFNIDPVIVRLIWAVITFAGGAGVAIYIICAIIMPRDTTVYFDDDDEDRGDR